jgi:hypothetical protein
MFSSEPSDFLTEAYQTLASLRANERLARREIAETVEATRATISKTKALLVEVNHLVESYRAPA